VIGFPPSARRRISSRLFSILGALPPRSHPSKAVALIRLSSPRALPHDKCIQPPLGTPQRTGELPFHRRIPGSFLRSFLSSFLAIVHRYAIRELVSEQFDHCLAVARSRMLIHVPLDLLVDFLTPRHGSPRCQ